MAIFLGSAQANSQYDQLLLAHGVDMRHMAKLGEGFFGTAYRLEDGRVLKVTQDETEVYLATWLLKNQSSLPTIFPHIDAVFSLPVGPLKAPFFAPKHGRDYYIKREYLDEVPRSPHMDEFMRSFAGWSNYGYRMVRFPEKAAQYRTQIRLFATEIVQILSSCPMTDGNIALFDDARWRRNITNSMGWVAVNGAYVGDIKYGNMGLRQGTRDLVIADLGVSESPEKIEPQALAGLGRPQLHARPLLRTPRRLR